MHFLDLLMTANGKPGAIGTLDAWLKPSSSSVAEKRPVAIESELSRSRLQRSEPLHAAHDETEEKGTELLPSRPEMPSPPRTLPLDAPAGDKVDGPAEEPAEEQAGRLMDDEFWNDRHVRMPCSKSNVDKRGRWRWAKIESALREWRFR